MTEAEKKKDGIRLQPGTVVDKRYRITRLIKAGGMGAVYQAEDMLQDGKVVAVKEMLDTSTSPEERHTMVDRFLSEVQVLARLSHPNIPRVMDSFLEKDSFYFVLEYVEGTDLGSYLKDHGSPGLSSELVVEWAIQILSALEYLHAMRPPIVHRDIKPSNILYRPQDGRVLVIDFGIARVTNPQDGYWIGTPGYAPAEQHLGKHEPRSDLYALGASMHELLTGAKPSTTTWDFPSFKDLDVEISAQLEDAIALALATFPQDRFANSTQMREALERILGYQPAHHASSGRGFEFSTAVTQWKSNVLDPLLKSLITRYNNECLTRSLPAQLEYLVFTLGVVTPFELIVKRNDTEETLEFFEKQGILGQSQLGRISPSDPHAGEATRTLIEQFASNYEHFKFSG